MNSFGRNFRISIFGESHGDALGIVIDGVEVGVSLCVDDFKIDIDRRKPGAKGTTTRIEDDIPIIVSGLFNGHTTGAPLTILFKNNNTISSDYKNLVEHPRPSHSDFVARKKYKEFNDYRGGGHFSGRITLALVAAGVVAKKVILKRGISVDANIIEIGGKRTKEDMDSIINQVFKSQDSVGGIVECVAKGVPVGLGEPFFDSMESVISHLVFSIPAIKAIEFGDGFDSAKCFGSYNNDVIVDAQGKTDTNHSGGIVGGISNGNDIVFRVAVKPTASISKAQKTFSFKTNNIEELIINGRHDACIALRVPVILEAVTAMALADAF